MKPQIKSISLILLSLALVTACNRETEQTPDATKTSAPPPLSITYCDIAPSDLCLEGFGQEGEDKMLILFKADDWAFADIMVHVDHPDGEVIFECQQSQNFPENVYCLGDAFDDEENIKLEIYSKEDEKLIAVGVFFVEYGYIPAPDVEFGVPTPEIVAADATSTPEYVDLSDPNPTSTPDPAYPNYPNPTSSSGSATSSSYPNPTPAP